MDDAIREQDYALEDPRRGLRAELSGWELFWTRLEATGEGLTALEALCRNEEDEARRLWQGVAVTDDETAAAVRRLFRDAGCDPTRYRPSSEALLRRILKGDPLPSIHPFVDLNNCLSVRLLVPCCVLAEGSFTPPLTLRAGREGEAMDSLRGPFSLAGKPLLEDAGGPFGTPITDGERVKVKADTTAAWLVAYLPEGSVGGAAASRILAGLLTQAPVARRTA
ncbi:MAG: hypothetical protein KDD11_01760 [Acidobacteria bacterium]|nr:hypothetical protein [Acidobacteriota bacterium]